MQINIHIQYVCVNIDTCVCIYIYTYTHITLAGSNLNGSCCKYHEHRTLALRSSWKALITRPAMAVLKSLICRDAKKLL